MAKHRKTKRYDEGGDIEIANASDDPIRTLNKLRGWTDTGEDDSGAPPVAEPSRKTAPKQRIVSKKELEESGLSLRDFLNRERGLTRREESKAKSSSAPDTGDETARLLARKPKTKGALEFGPDVTYPRKVRSPYSYERESTKSTPREDRLLKNLKMPRADEYTGMGSLKFSKGGSASKRADGIAQRGKTRGKLC